jgi:hypothetical protein
MRITLRHHTIMFEAETGTATLIDPTDRPTYRGPSRARRIVVNGPTTGPAEVRWRFFVHMGGGYDLAQPAAHADAGPSPE